MAPLARRSGLLEKWSTGLVGRDVPDLERAGSFIPQGTRLYVGFIDGEDLTLRVAAAGAVRRLGFVPVPVIAARRLDSEAMLEELLAALVAVDASERVLLVAGDLDRPLGPYPDTASLIASGALQAHGVRTVDVAAHPGGHPARSPTALWSALSGKAAALEGQGLAGDLVTQFGFDPGLALTWLAELRALGISLPVQLGVPGPAPARRLRWYATRCGVEVTERVAKDYGLSVADSSGVVGPERFLDALAAGYDPRAHGTVRLHFNALDGIAPTVRWIRKVSEHGLDEVTQQPDGTRAVRRREPPTADGDDL